jgi:hypothetical protein
MFCTNALLHNTSFDFKFSLAGNMTLTTSTPSGTKNQGLFSTFIAHSKSKRKKI